MSAIPQRSMIPFPRFEPYREAQEMIRLEAAALNDVAAGLDERFCDAVRLILACQGRVIVTGIGKAGLIGQKIAATLCSTGTPSHFLHPAEAVHGDLGCLSTGDVVVALSNSGETEEVCRLSPVFRDLGVTLIALTSTETNSLAAEADVVIPIGRLREVDANGLAPSTTTTAMLAVGDALALVVSRQRGFTAERFAVFHPGGNLGRQLRSVADVMRPLNRVRIASDSESVRNVFAQHTCSGRRTGAVMLVDANGRLSGLFTDSDLARLLESRRDDRLDGAISDVMTREPLTIVSDAKLGDVVDLLADRKVSELPVIDAEGRPMGLVDITDIIGLIPPGDLAA